MDSAPHIPVMLPEVLAALKPSTGESYVDGTFGAGGYSRAILGAASCRVFAIDRDRTALEAAEIWRAGLGDRLTLISGRFGDAETLLRAAGTDQVDGFVLDIGVSSMQIDQAARGFSFRNDGPLDMRMDRDSGQSAADLLATIDETELADLIYRYGEERNSRRIARAIVLARAETPLISTAQLAFIVRKAQPAHKGSRGDVIDPATRTFQALRIAVNDELGELSRALGAAERLLRVGGRLLVVSFHSLEDGIVKRFMTERAGCTPAASRHLPMTDVTPSPPSFLPPAKAIGASDEEAARNPRSRSARLRVAVRTGAPAWSPDESRHVA